MARIARNEGQYVELVTGDSEHAQAGKSGGLAKPVPSPQFLNSLRLTEYDSSAPMINVENAANTGAPQPDDLAVGPFQMKLNLVREMFEQGDLDGRIDDDTIQRFLNGNEQEQAGIAVTRQKDLTQAIAEKTQETLSTMGDYGSTTVAQNLYHNAPTATKVLIDRAFGSSKAFKQAVEQQGAQAASEQLLNSIMADPLVKFRTDRSRQIFKNRAKNLLKHVGELEDPNYDPALLPPELREVWYDANPPTARTTKGYQQDQAEVEQGIIDALNGVVAQPQTPEEVYQTTNHIVEQLVANPLKSGDYTRGQIARWLYGGTDADRDMLPAEMSSEQFLSEVLGVKYPESVMKDLKFDKDVPGLVNVMGWLSAASVESLRQAPLLATDIATDPTMLLAHPAVANLGNPSKFATTVWEGLKSWFTRESPTHKAIASKDSAATITVSDVDIPDWGTQMMKGGSIPKGRVTLHNAPQGVVLAKIGEKVVGRAEVRASGDTPVLSKIEVLPGARRRGIASQLVDYAQQQHPGKPLQWTMRTSDGSKLKASLDARQAGASQHMPQAFTKFEETKQRLAQKKAALEVGKTRPLHVAAAEGSQFTPTQLRMLGFNTALNDADQLAFIQLLYDDALTMSQAARAGNLKAFHQAFEQTAHDAIVQRSTATATGRGLRALETETAEAWKVYSKQLQELYENRTLSPQELMKRVALMDDPAEILKMTVDSTRPGFVAMLAEMSVNGLLGGFTTLTMNAVSGPLMMAYHGLNKTAAGLFAWNRSDRQALPKVLQGSGVTKREGIDFLTGAAGAWREAAQMFKKSWLLEDAVSPGTKLDTFRQPAITGDNVAAMLKGPFEWPITKLAVDWIGKSVRVFGRTLTATDELNKTMIFRGEVKSLSSRVARDEATALFPNDPQAALAHYNKVKADVIANPESYADVMRQAGKTAQQLTFTNPSDIKFIRDYSNFVSMHPGLRLVTPFVTVPANLMSTSAELLALPSAMRVTFDLVKKGLSTPDPVGRQMMLGQLAVSTTIATGMGAAVMGGWASGGGPADPKQRQLKEAAGWKPYSVGYDSDGDGYVDRYVEYKRTEPFGFAMGVIADFYEAMGVWDGQPIEGVGDLADVYGQFSMLFTLATLKNMQDGTFISSMVKFNEMLADFGSQDPDAVGRSVARFSQALTPFSGTQKMINRGISPEMREVRSWLDGIRAVIPGMATFKMADDHPMKPFYPDEAPVLAQSYSALGQPQYWHHGFGPRDLPNWLSEYIPEAAQVVADAIDPVRTSRLEDPRLQKIAKVFLENNVELSRPDRKKEGFEIPIIHYDTISMLTAKGSEGLPEPFKAKYGKDSSGKPMPPLVDVLDQIVSSPAFLAAPNNVTKQALVSRILTARRNWAFGVLTQIDPDLLQQYEHYQAEIAQHGEPLTTNPRQRAF